MIEWITSSSALILVVVALRGLLKNKLRPTIRYALWSLVLVRLLLPFSLFESGISLGSALQPLTQQTGAAVAQYEAVYDRVVQQQSQSGITPPPSKIREEVRQQVYDDTYASIADRYTQQGITIPEPQLRQEAQTQAQTMDLLALAAEILPGIWYAGMVIMTLALLISNGWFSWNLLQTRKNIPCPDFPLQVYETAYAATPCLFSLIRPKVYLTPEAARDSDLRRHVLAHELTHFRHRDHIWSLLRCICLVIHWYNPLVWVAAFLSKKDAELACDEATIRALGEDQRIAYGKTLIDMTCVKQDSKGFLITATTMIGSKRTLKDRITTISRKPKNALLAVVACILILSIAAGCTFTGAPAEHTDPTTPTAALDAVYEKVQAAAQAINTQEALHVKYYISPEMPLSETDLTSRTSYTEVWISGEDLYEERHEQDLVIPQILHYHGDIYDHIRDNLWLSAISSTRTPDDYHLQIPRRSDCTMSFTESNSYLDVTFANNSGNNSSGTEIRLDADGNLVWYATYIHTTGSANAPGEGAVMYVIMTYEDTNSQQIKAHLDAVAPELIANMQFSTYDDATELEISEDGCLYIKSGIRISEEPVTAYTQSYNFIFYLTESGKLIQTSTPGDISQKVLYEISTDTSPLACSYPNLYFIDGTDLMALDVTTGTASVVGSFENCGYIQPVTSTWLWVYAQGNNYAYDIATGKIAPLLTEGALDCFVAGEWPSATFDLPENYTLSDTVTAYEEKLSWKCGLEHDHTLSVSLPKITPYSDKAIRLQNRIDADWQILIEEARNCKETATCPAILYTDFEASLTQNLLSIMVHARWDYYDDSYEVYNIDAHTGWHLRPADMVKRYLSVSYPEFIQAVHQFRLDELKATQSSSNIRDSVTYLVPEFTGLKRSALYVNQDGTLMLRYDALNIGGADSHPTVTPFPGGLKFSGKDAAYAWLFSLYGSDRGSWDSGLGDYWAIIQAAYGADIDEFESQLSKMDADTQQRIWELLTHGDPTKTK